MGIPNRRYKGGTFADLSAACKATEPTVFTMPNLCHRGRCAGRYTGKNKHRLLVYQYLSNELKSAFSLPLALYAPYSLFCWLQTMTSMQRLITAHSVWPWLCSAPQMCSIWEQSQQVSAYQEQEAMCHGWFPLGHVSRCLIHYTPLQHPVTTLLYKAVCETCLFVSSF